jgi:hypothetical protein
VGPIFLAIDFDDCQLQRRLKVLHYHRRLGLKKQAIKICLSAAWVLLKEKEVSHFTQLLPRLTWCAELEKYPDGWPRLAAFLNSADNSAIFRRFGQLHCRELVMLQTEITKLEQKLAELDKHDSESASTSYRLKTTYHEDGWDTAHMNLREKIRVKLLIYGMCSLSKVLKASANLGSDDMLLKEAQLRALQRTPKRHHATVFNWLCHLKPVDNGECDWIYHPDDFVSVEPTSEGRWAEVTPPPYKHQLKETSAKDIGKCLL